MYRYLTCWNFQTISETVTVLSPYLQGLTETLQSFYRPPKWPLTPPLLTSHPPWLLSHSIPQYPPPPPPLSSGLSQPVLQTGQSSTTATHTQITIINKHKVRSDGYPAFNLRQANRPCCSACKPSRTWWWRTQNHTQFPVWVEERDFGAGGQPCWVVQGLNLPPVSPFTPSFDQCSQSQKKW